MSAKPTKYKVLKRESVEFEESFKTAKKIAEKLRAFLDQKEIYKEIVRKDVPGAHGKAIENIIRPFLSELGFTYQKELYSEEDPECRVRPDFLLDQEKIMLEVERGKTRMNNADLLDMWKCHWNPTKYLFLVIPKMRRSGNGDVKPQFHLTEKILGRFFEKNNYVNVDAVFLFRYGADS
jgi:hypothetical protein